MATSKEFKNYIIEQLANLKPSEKFMMGEYLLYVNNVYFGGIFDDRLMIKITDTNSNYGLIKELPYKNAKPMYLVENIDDKSYLESLVIDTIKGLKN